MQINVVKATWPHLIPEEKRNLTAWVEEGSLHFLNNHLSTTFWSTVYTLPVTRRQCLHPKRRLSVARCCSNLWNALLMYMYINIIILSTFKINDVTITLQYCQDSVLHSITLREQVSEIRHTIYRTPNHASTRTYSSYTAYRNRSD